MTADETYTSLITPAAGGVWTDDVGVVTGPLELRTTCTVDGQLTVTVRYQEADEWYAVRGGSGRLVDPADAKPVHALLTAVLDRPS